MSGFSFQSSWDSSIPNSQIVIPYWKVVVATNIHLQKKHVHLKYSQMIEKKHQRCGWMPSFRTDFIGHVMMLGCSFCRSMSTNKEMAKGHDEESSQVRTWLAKALGYDKQKKQNCILKQEVPTKSTAQNRMIQINIPCKQWWLCSYDLI